MSCCSKLSAALLILAGILCIMFPLISSIAIEVIVGIFMIVGAVLSLFNFSMQKGVWDKLTVLIFAAIYAVGGYFLLSNVLSGVVAITIVLGALFVVQGLYSMVYWMKMKGESKGACLHFVSGVVSILLGVMMLTTLVESLWIVGMLVGLNLIFEGVALLAGKSCQWCDEGENLKK